MDGADWLQTFVDIHRRDAVRILDFPHAAEHLSKLLEALRGRGMHFLLRCLNDVHMCSNIVVLLPLPVWPIA